ncbi:hypothetical protein [Chryseolinea soli]|uniref:Uncharacterized protein n=1 Tax=Chryseolinea soli TaxID=2321403 RepID=A0A385SX48_9BACT|nr:hypothetical protein [Chryseolinea soli]AYB34585.1 hypothetical protein D4L85_30145 [Chryseolinea soli]
MAQFIPFDSKVQVNGQTILSVVNALHSGQETRRIILEKNGIKDPKPGAWFPQSAWLKAFEEISKTIGSYTLFSIGKAIPEHATFPPEIDSLEKALSSIHVAYQMNHRGGEIGYYKLVWFDGPARKAMMECKNPYPSEFDRGIITTMLRRFKPRDSFKYDVSLNLAFPTRLKGNDSCMFNIVW